MRCDPLWPCRAAAYIRTSFIAQIKVRTSAAAMGALQFEAPKDGGDVEDWARSLQQLLHEEARLNPEEEAQWLWDLEHVVAPRIDAQIRDVEQVVYIYVVW